MPRETGGPEGNRRDALRRRTSELETLIGRWEQVDDPGSKWLLHLLRQALAIARNRLRHLDPGER